MPIDLPPLWMMVIMVASLAISLWASGWNSDILARQQHLSFTRPTCGEEVEGESNPDHLVNS